jgi:hypothetical protein
MEQIGGDAEITTAAIEAAVNKRLDKQLRDGLLLRAAEASVNSLLDQKIQQHLTALGGMSPSAKAVEASINRLVDERIRQNLLRIELTGGRPITSPSAQKVLPEFGEGPLVLAKASNPTTREALLVAKFGHAWTRAAQAAAKGDAASANKYYAQADEIFQQIVLSHAR